MIYRLWVAEDSRRRENTEPSSGYIAVPTTTQLHQCLSTSFRSLAAGEELATTSCALTLHQTAATYDVV